MPFLRSLMQISQRLNKSFLSFTLNSFLFQLLYLRIVSMLFSTSDFKHAVCTPAMVLLSQVLAQVITICSMCVWCDIFIISHFRSGLFFYICLFIPAESSAMHERRIQRSFSLRPVSWGLFGCFFVFLVSWAFLSYWCWSLFVIFE